MEKDLVSIVVPVYNTEKYLEECIESIIHQTYKNLEIIFVDDGSTDSSVDIINKYKEQDNRIKLIKQKNQYAGVARNNGMKHATGKYIMFLDSDDYFKLNMIEKMHKAAVKYDTELVACNIRVFGDVKKEHILKATYNHRKSVLFPKQNNSNIFFTINNGPTNKLVLKSIIDKYHLQFQNIKTSNDVSFVKVLFCIVEKVVFINKPFINYRVHNNSLQHNFEEKHYIKLRINDIESFKEIKKELEIRDLFALKIEDDYYKWLDICVRVFMLECSELECFDELYECIKENLIPNVFSNMNKLEEYPYMYKLFNSSSSYNFLFCEYKNLINDLSSNYISKSSKSYKLCSLILAIPKFVYKKIEGIE